MNWEKNFDKARHRKQEPPSGYFDKLEDKAIGNWKQKSSEKRADVKRLAPWAWVAAAAVILLLIYIMPGRSTSPDLFQEMTSEQAAYYYLQTSDVPVAELWLDTEDIPADTIEAWLLSDATLDASTIEEIY